jgi:ABC-type glycerol-3-phosphate transport system permease component
MDKTIIKRKRFLPFLQSQKNRILFKIINIYLIIGLGSLLVTMFYLIAHLNQADSIIRYCIPGFILGVSSGIFYFIGYQSIISEQQAESNR